MESRPAVFLISLLPQYVEPLLNGLKKYEFRRVRWNINSSDWVFIYESRGKGKVVGKFVAGEVVYGGCSELLSLEKEIFLQKSTEKYLYGAKSATAVEVKQVKVFNPSLSLNSFGITRPPQSYIRLRKVPRWVFLD